ncbi:unnamed protein product [Zymoseptoria tritici ST99CH_3D1]|nr:unnamed protein product [Zymoseptoria tritici ST99CH_3D1]
MACIILADGSRVDSAKVIGNGADGFVVRYEDHVLKIPSLLGEIQPSGEIEAHGESLEAEKEVYRRLQNVSGVAECLGYVIARCHESGVLVLDIALRNFLLTDEFDLRIVDFANSSLVSREADITKTKINGHSPAVMWADASPALTVALAQVATAIVRVLRTTTDASHISATE